MLAAQGARIRALASSRRRPDPGAPPPSMSPRVPGRSTADSAFGRSDLARFPPRDDAVELDLASRS